MAQGLRRDGQELSGMPTDKLVQRAPHVRFVVQADELLTAFVELESVIRAAERPEDCRARTIKLDNCRANQVKASSITSSDSFNVSSARLNKPQGLDLRRDTV